MGIARRDYLSGFQGHDLSSRRQHNAGSRDMDRERLYRSTPGRKSRFGFLTEGSVFGDLTVIHVEYGPRGGPTSVVCRCSCGAESRPLTDNLRYGRSTRCDTCAKRQARYTQTGYKIIMADDRARDRWLDRHKAVLQRTIRGTHPSWEDYGGRGIDVDPEWTDAGAFLRWVIQQPGYLDPKLELERVDNEKGYWPGNCKLATRAEQMANTRATRRIEHEGVVYCAAHFARQFAPHLAETTVAALARRGKRATEIIATKGRIRRSERGTA